MSSWIESTFGTKMSPTILFIIVLLAIILFIAALVHLLIRFLLKHPSPNPPETRIVQRQLQHLFQIHDSGLDQSLIDTLPFFLYKDIVGLNFKHRLYNNRPESSFDCAVCLCEFSEQDKLRLLPLCSHAFHIDCIDTWLLSNSTCPLCRGVILSSDDTTGTGTNIPCFYFDGVEHGSSRNHQEYGEVSSVLADQKRVFSVRLGKFKNSTNIVVDDDHESGCLSMESGEIGETSRGQNGDLTCDARRCFSMGSFQYVVADSELQVELSESGNDRKGRGGQSCHFTCNDEVEEKKIKVGESYSVSKIWLWSRRGTSRLQTSTSVV